MSPDGRDRPTPAEDSGEIPSPTLHLTSDATVSQDEFGVGQAIDLTLSDPQRGSTGATDRYLFYTAQRGLRDHAVQATRDIERHSVSPPHPTSRSRASGSPDPGTAPIRRSTPTSERRTRADGHARRRRAAVCARRPVRLQVTTRDASGDPVPATVILRAVDEKLFALGGAAATRHSGRDLRRGGAGSG